MKTLLTNGYSLIEILIVLIIVSLIASLSFPAWKNLLAKRELKQEVQQLVAVIKLARVTAIGERATVTLCHSANAKNCQGRWLDGVIAFIDHNANRKPDSGDRIFLQQHNQNSKLSLTLKAFPSSNSLQFSSIGLLDNSNGSFYFCYNHQQTIVRISKSGRTKIEQGDKPC